MNNLKSWCKGTKLYLGAQYDFHRILTEDLLYSLVLDYPDAEILGHRDLPWVRKSCPCFDVKEWLKEIDFHL
ncbi:hypothetical protein [Segatella copri]|uniref:hypothetical protein n=1 Tax=Segatella copri TaxID=165179 RepID=UPI003F5A10C6